jgi:hypothetical protein
MGYGSRALQALNSFYSGEYFNPDETSHPEPSYPDAAAIVPVCYSPDSTSVFFIIFVDDRFANR